MSDFSSVDLQNLNGFFRGVVVDNADPSQFGRIKINVFGVFNNIGIEHLPWAVPAFPTFRGAGIGYGYFDVPEIGSSVWCFFHTGDVYEPVYFAAAPDGVHGLPSERTTNYPARTVWKTKNGITFYIDDTDKEVTLEHPSGTTITIDGVGNVTLISAANVIIKGATVQINP